MIAVRLPFGALVTASLLAATSPAMAGPPDWQVVSNASEGGFTVEFYVDANSLQRDGAIVQFIERAEFTHHAKGWKQVISQSLVDCRTNQSRAVRMKVTKTNGTAQVFDQSQTSTWADIPPDTNGAFVRDFVCAQ